MMGLNVKYISFKSLGKKAKENLQDLGRTRQRILRLDSKRSIKEKYQNLKLMLCKNTPAEEWKDKIESKRTDFAIHMFNNGPV